MKGLFLFFVGLFHWHVPPVASPHTTNQAYTYWYSAQQREALNQVLGGPLSIQSRYTVLVDGKPQEYTECQPSSLKQPYGRFTDFRKVGSISGQPCRVF